MFRLISKIGIILTLLFTSLSADYESGEKIFKEKCSSCHKGYISAKVLKENFYNQDNKLLNLTIPTVNMLAYALKDSPLHIGDKSDPEMQKFEIEEFLKDYLYHPNLDNSICDPLISKHYIKKESMQGKVSEDEISQLTDYLFDYKKERLKKHPKKIKKMTDLSGVSHIIEQAKMEKKLIIIEAMSETCHYCKKMKKEVLSKENVQKAIHKNFIFVEVDVDKTKLPFGLEKSYKKITPSFFIVNTEEKLLNSYPGSWTTEDFLEILKENEK